MLAQFTNITAHLYLICRYFYAIHYMVLVFFGNNALRTTSRTDWKKLFYILVTKFLHGGNDNKLHIV